MRASISRTAFAAVAVAGALFAAGLPAVAQSSADTSQNPQFTVRAGGYFTNASAVKNTVGSSFFAAGVDYDIHDELGVSRTVLSGDYISRSSGGNNLRIFPVTIGQFAVGNPDNVVQAYYGGGIGAYFVHQDFGSGSQHDTARFGGYIGGGLVYNKFLVLDVRYHLITSQNGVDPGGLEVTAGIRF